MAKKETWDQEKARVQKMTEKEFNIFCRARWDAYQARITNSEDSVPYSEFYSEACSDYSREPNN